MGSACGCMCFGLLLFPDMIVLLGWNEKSFVCDRAKIIFAESDAVEVPADKCSSASTIQEYTDKFAFFSCPIDQTTLKEWTPNDFNTNLTVIKFKSPAARQEVEIYQCKENKRVEQSKQGTKTIKKTIYSYSRVWSSSHIDVNSFERKDWSKIRSGCGQDFTSNPDVPNGVTLGQVAQTADSVKSGVFSLSKELRDDFYASTALSLEAYKANFTGGAVDELKIATDSLQVLSDGHTLATCPPNQLKVGCVTIKYYYAGVTQVSVFANIANDGTTQTHPTPSSWGCPASSMHEMKMEEATKAEMVKKLQGENQTKTWILRLVGCIGAWLAIYFILSPISAAADIVGDCLDFIPCIGGALESLVEGVVTTVLCVMSCGVGCSCALFVISIVWVAMRPLVGGIMMAVAILLFVGAGVIRSQYQVPDGAKRRRRKNADEEEMQEA